MRALFFLLRSVQAIGLAITGAAFSGAASAEEARIAVATNFKPVMDELEAVFEAETGHSLQTIAGSTGKLSAQIRHGAPFDVFLAADTVHPQRLSASGHAIPEVSFTYAVGRLALWSPQSDPAIDAESLSDPGLRYIAIANPELAPYGAAAIQTMNAMRVSVSLTDKLVRGENVGQAFAFVRTRNAELGFVALSQILSQPETMRGTYWLPPQSLYAPIKQDAILLQTGRTNIAARTFLNFLKSETSVRIIQRAGYEAP